MSAWPSTFGEVAEATASARSMEVFQTNRLESSARTSLSADRITLRSDDQIADPALRQCSAERSGATGLFAERFAIVIASFGERFLSMKPGKRDALATRVGERQWPFLSLPRPSFIPDGLVIDDDTPSLCHRRPAASPSCSMTLSSTSSRYSCCDSACKAYADRSSIAICIFAVANGSVAPFRRLSPFGTRRPCPAGRLQSSV